MIKPMASNVSALSSVVAKGHQAIHFRLTLAGLCPCGPFASPSLLDLLLTAELAPVEVSPTRGCYDYSVHHPLPRQDLHLQACQRPKAAHRNLFFARSHAMMPDAGDLGLSLIHISEPTRPY